MTPELYRICLLVVACFLTYFSIYLLFGKIPQKLHRSAYHRSRQYMSCAFLVLAISIFVFFATNMREMPPQIRIALNVSCYYIASNLFTISFILLIGRKIVLQKIRRKHQLMALAVAFPISAWAVLLIPNEDIIHVVQSIMAVALFVSILLNVRLFFKEYNRVILQGEYYYAEGIGVHLSWMINSVYAIVGVGVLSALMGFISYITPHWILFIYMVCFIFVCMYIFGEMLNFNIIYGDLVESSGNIDPISEVDIRKTTITPQMSQQIEEQLVAWIEAKEFCQNGVNIMTMANSLSTNRFYLSTYINTTYKCSFRQWVSRLRVNEAKILMQEMPDATITTIAEQVGFVSLTSLTHAFKNIEGLSPKEWISANINGDISTKANS